MFQSKRILENTELGRSQKRPEANLNDLCNYNNFKNINGESFEDETDNDITNDIRNANKYINKPITEEEMEKAILKLKNNKALGQDNSKNEHTKYTSALTLFIYSKLFNLIFNHGLILKTGRTVQ